MKAVDMEIIKSRQNEYIKMVKKLSQGKYRKETGLCYVEGEKCVQEALMYSDVETILYTEKADVEKLSGYGCRKLCISEELMEYLSDAKTPQPVSCVTRMRPVDIDVSGKGILIFLEDVQDPQNIGAIIRTADAIGALGVIMSEKCADYTSSRAIRSSMGSCFHMPLLRTSDLMMEVEKVRKDGFSVLAAHLKGKEVFAPSDRTAILIGNESKGLSDQLSEKADILVKIPMKGKAESLNAAVAAGVLMYRVFWK